MSKGTSSEPKKGKLVGSAVGCDNRIFDRYFDTYFRANFSDCKVDSMVVRADGE